MESQFAFDCKKQIELCDYWGNLLPSFALIVLQPTGHRAKVRRPFSFQLDKTPSCNELGGCKICSGFHSGGSPDFSSSLPPARRAISRSIPTSWTTASRIRSEEHTSEL